ncbi:MAG: DUF4118 domain-containing protein [Clostridiales bacterium]|nr:DUF4118 domain-containing protein [Clostridiales bacterium]
MSRSIKGMIKNIIVTIGILSAVTGLSLLLDQQDDVSHSDAYVSMLFILAVLVISRVTDGYFYGLAASVYGVLTVNYFFTFPYYAFNFSLSGYPITMVALFTVSTLTSALTTRMKRQEQARAEAAKEKLRGDLLRAISHDFRTPLTSIMGANAALMENADALSSEQKRALHQNIGAEAMWLQRMVENLLSVTRISGETGAKIEKTPQVIEEIVAAASEKFHARFPDFSVRVGVPQEALLCPMDALLVEQVLLNLLQNAAQHAEGATHVEILLSREKGCAKISVLDDGCGMDKALLGRFRRDREQSWEAAGDSARASGIGLSVCAAIATAHGGSLRLENREGGGLCASLLLPLEG